MTVKDLIHACDNITNSTIIVIKDLSEKEIEFNSYNQIFGTVLSFYDVITFFLKDDFVEILVNHKED